MSDIPLEKQTAHQRWELADFGEKRTSPATEQAAQHTAATIQQMREIAKLREEAKTTGRAEGYEEGFQKGIDDAKQSIKEKVNELSKLISSFNNQCNQIAENSSEQILIFAIDLTRAMLGSALQINPTLIIPIIQRCVKNLPFNSGLTITVNPKDVDVIKEAFSQQINTQGWTIFDDDSITPGGLKIDTTKNHIDATVDTRWKNLTSELNRESDWLKND